MVVLWKGYATAMSGNCCRIAGMNIITAPQQMEVHGKVEMLLTGSFGVVAGAAAPETPAQRVAIAMYLATA